MMISKPADAVCFDESVRVYHVPLLTEFTDEERSAVWLTPSDMEENQADVRRTVKKIRRADRHGISIDDDSTVCIRGIEHLRSSEHMEQRKINRDVCVASLLGEQARQRALGIVDEEALARASAIGSRWARELARGLGLGDEAEVRKMRQRQRTIQATTRGPARRYQPAMPSFDAAAASVDIVEKARKLCDGSGRSAVKTLPNRQVPGVGLGLPQLRAEIALELRGLEQQQKKMPAMPNVAVGGNNGIGANKVPRSTSAKQFASSAAPTFVTPSLLANNNNRAYFTS